MFRVGDVILSEEIATSRFSCDITKCKGACCFIGDAGAPVSNDEIPVLRKAYQKLKNDLRPEARKVVEEEGLVTRGSGNSSGYEINCVNGQECIFVQYNKHGVAECAIQKAFYEKRFFWEKPISCHLYPIRLSRISGIDYANFEYIPDLCGAGCEKGERDGVYLADFLETALTRRYGSAWYKEFSDVCEEIRSGH